MLRLSIVLIILLALPNTIWAANQHPAVTKPIPIAEIQGYQSYPEVIQKIIFSAYQLTQQNLNYKYGSADPKKGGMDCSGTIYYLLRSFHVTDTPRSAEDMYQWVKQKGKLHTIEISNNLAEFSNLKPGDLLFWRGTYKMRQAASISHVMLYLGKNKSGQPLMFGASDGRTYQGKPMWGVSVFDFYLPKIGAAAHFVGYSCIPHLTCADYRLKR